MSGSASVSFTLENQASGSADAMASSLETLKSTIQSDVAELRAMQTAMRSLQSNTTEGAESIKTLGEQISAQKSKISSSSAEFVKLGGSFKNIKSPAGELGEGDDALKGFLDTAKGGLGPMGGLFERLNLLKTAGPAAVFIAATVAIVALGAAIISVTIEMMKFSIAAADAGLKQRLAFGSVANTAGVKELESMVGKLSSQLPNATADIAKFAQEQYKAGLRGAELEKATIKASMAAAGLGKDTKLGSERARQAMLPLETQMVKAKENWSSLFAGVKVEGAEKALKSVLDLLDMNSSTGKALKAVFEGMMNPLFNSIANGGPFFKAFFKEVVIMALVTAIAVKQVGNALSSAFGGSNISGLEMIQAGILAAKVVVIGLAVAIGLVVMVFIALAAAIGGVVIGAVVVVVGVFAALGAAVYGAWSFISGIDWSGIATGLIDGLVNGITSGAGAVIAAVKSLASGMTGAIKGALGINSPSKVFAEFGGFTAQGMADGIDDGAPQVESAVSAMVKVPAMASPEAGMPTGKPGASAGSSIMFAPTITVNGGGNASDIAEAARAAVYELFLSMAQTYGLSPA